MKTDLFSDESLTQLLDHYPRNLLQAFTMGTDATKRADWAPVEIGALSGAELLAAVKRGRLWLNILRVQDADMRLKDVLDRVYAQLANDCPHFKPFRYSGTLLISSPSAQVYYHVDGPPNLLWHIRGSKRIYIYPAEDRRLVPLTVMEDIFASVADEEMPFDPSFDDLAVVYDLKPGDVASWPHNSPHRVVNTGALNVSLSTNHWTEESEHRKLVYVANRFFRRRVGFPVTSTREDGMWATAGNASRIGFAVVSVSTRQSRASSTKRSIESIRMLHSASLHSSSPRVRPLQSSPHREVRWSRRLAPR